MKFSILDEQRIKPKPFTTPKNVRKVVPKKTSVSKKKNLTKKRFKPKKDLEKEDKNQYQPISSKKRNVLNSTTEKSESIAKKGTPSFYPSISIKETKGNLLTPDGYVTPRYPTKAKRKRLQGTVILEVKVRNGSQDAISIIQSSGHTILDNAAKNAIQSWKFKNISTIYKQKITYVLR